MWGRRRGRPSRREQIQGINAAIKFYAAAADKDATPHLLDVPVVRERKRAQGTPDKPLERDVLKAVLHALALDPRVALVERRQSGVFQDGDRYIRIGKRGVLDISGVLKGGRYFEIEVKRPGETPRPEQLERIAEVKRAGAISGYCWSIESALGLLP